MGKVNPRYKYLCSLMGHRVVISHRLCRTFMNDGQQVWTPTYHERTGWLVGVRYAQNGAVDRDPEYGVVWCTSGSVLVALFAEWPSAKHYYVPATVVREYKHGIDPPPRNPNTVGMDAAWRKEMSAEMANWPRNVSGHFIKATGSRAPCALFPCDTCSRSKTCLAPDSAILMRRRDAKKNG